jgi:hydrogenase maturation protease
VKGNIVVIGVGNVWRRDDGAGIEIARRAAPRLADDARVVELDGEPGRVIEAWDGATLAVLVDGVRTGAPAGTLHRIDTSDADARASSASSHALGPAAAFQLGQALGRLPARVAVLGIEVVDTSPGVGLSPPVEDAVAGAIEEILAIVTGADAGRSR